MVWTLLLKAHSHCAIFSVCAFCKIHWCIMWTLPLTPKNLFSANKKTQSRTEKIAQCKWALTPRRSHVQCEQAFRDDSDTFLSSNEFTQDIVFLWGNFFHHKCHNEKEINIFSSVFILCLRFSYFCQFIYRMIIWNNYVICVIQIFLQNSFVNSCFFFLLLFFEDTCPFCGATYTPVLDFWWHLPWVSKPRWILLACFLACIPLLLFTSDVTPADLLMASMVAYFVSYTHQQR